MVLFLLHDVIGSLLFFNEGKKHFQVQYSLPLEKVEFCQSSPGKCIPSFHHIPLMNVIQIPTNQDSQISSHFLYALLSNVSFFC